MPVRDTGKQPMHPQQQAQSHSHPHPPLQNILSADTYYAQQFGQHPEEEEFEDEPAAVVDYEFGQEEVCVRCLVLGYE